MIPKEYLCPITGVLIKEPVIISNEKNGDAICYEQTALQSWFDQNKTHPKTLKKLNHLTFLSSPEIKKEIQTFLINHQVCTEEEFLNVFVTGNVKALEQLNYLSSYAALEYEGESLLHIAVKNGNLPMVRWLLEQGCNIHRRDTEGFTAFERAVQREDRAVKDLLILYGAEHPPLTPNELEDLLECQAKAYLTISNEEELQALVAFLTVNETIFDLTLQTFPLNQNHLDQIELLFKENNTTLRRFNIFSEKRSYSKIFQPYVDRNDETPTGLYFYKKALENRALIEAKEQHLVCPISGQIMELPVETLSGVVYERFYIEEWLKNHNTDFVTKQKLLFNSLVPKNELLQKTQAWRNKFNICSHALFISKINQGDLEQIKTLNYLEYYLHRDLNHGLSETPICIAARKGYWDIVKWLVDQGVEIHVFDKHGAKKTPLDWAFYRGNIEIAEWLITYKSVNITLENIAGNYPVWMAASNQQRLMLDFLLERGASILVKDLNQNTLLHLAMEHGNLEWIKALLVRGVEIDTQNWHGDTALHLAVQKGYIEVLSYLVDQGANINIRNLDRESLFELAQLGGHIEIQRFLILHGAEHTYLEGVQLANILNGVEIAKLNISDVREIETLANLLSLGSSLVRLDVGIAMWNDTIKDLFMSAMAANKKLQHLRVTAVLDLNAEYIAVNDFFTPYLKRNQIAYIAYERRCLDPYKNYLGPLFELFDRLLDPEKLGNKFVADVIAEQIHFILFTLPFEEMELELKERTQKACYEWIIYLLFNEPLIVNGKQQRAYFDLLKLAFLFLLNQKDPESYLNSKYDSFVFRKDLWVWSEGDFKEAYGCFKPCENLIPIDINKPIRIEVYDMAVNQMITLLKEEEYPLKEEQERKGKIKEKETILLLKTGFKPLYLKAWQKNAEIVFSPEWNHWRASIYRLKITQKARGKGFLHEDSELLIWSLKSKSQEIQVFQAKYNIDGLDEFWTQFERNPWKTLQSLNYLEDYLFCMDPYGNTLVHLAVQKKDLDLIDYLHQKGCDLGLPNRKGMTPLHLAIKNGCIPIFEFLFSRIEITHDLGALLLHYALTQSCLEAVLKLIENGVELNGNAVDHKGRSLLYLSLKNKQSGMTKFLLENWINVADEIDQNSLFLTVKNGDLDLVAWLINKGCSFDFQNHEGLSPLHIALAKGAQSIYLEIALMLIQQGCNLEIRDGLGLTPLDYAKKLLKWNPKSTFWHVLILNGAQHTPLDEDELKIILGDKDKAILSISDPEEFIILARLVKEDVFPNLSCLDLRLYGNAYEQTYLLEAIQYNRSLMRFNFSENDKDFSKFFDKQIKRNQWIARLKPYEKNLKSIGVTWDWVFSEKQLSGKSIPTIILELLETKILQLPLDQFSLEEAQACYQWIIQLLTSEKPFEPYYKPLLKMVLEKLFKLQNQNGCLIEEFLDDWLPGGEDVGQVALESIRQYQDLMKLKHFSVRLHHAFPNMYEHLQLICSSSGFLALPINQRITLISQADLLLYKIAVIISYEDYWKGKNKGKLNHGLQAWKKICQEFPEDGGAQEVRECLQKIKQAALVSWDKEAEIQVLFIRFFPVSRNEDVNQLYQYLGELDLEHFNMSVLDEILDKILREMPEEILEISDEKRLKLDSAL